MTTERYMAYLAERDLFYIPHRLQTQRALYDQLRDLIGVANKLGLYDAADFVRARLFGKIDGESSGERE